MAEQHIKGMAAAIVVDGVVTYKHFGHFNIGLEPITEEASKGMVFEIGSITKPLTGLALATLVDEGKLTKNAKIGECLPNVNPNSMIANRTIEHLVTHTSGLPRLPSDLLASATATDPYAKYSKKDVIENINAMDALKPAGESYEYSNLGYGVLGLILTEAHSKNATFDTMMKERVFDPLGMTNTSTNARLTTTGHDEDLEPVAEWKFDALKGAGALRSTPTDMIKLLVALANPPHSNLKKAIEMSIEKSPTAEGLQDIGMGWHLGIGDQKDVVWHNGGTAGYHSFIGVHKPSGRGVLLLSNTASYTVSKVGAYLLSNLIGVEKDLALPAYCPDEIPEELMKEYSHLYRHKGNLNFYVTTRRGKLYVQMTGHKRVQLHPVTPFLWTIRSTGATVEFDGIEWESGLPPHTLTYTHGSTVCHATRDGQEFRKFLKRTGALFSNLFGGSKPQTENSPPSDEAQPK